jgi:hypothetical protein
MHVDNTPLRDGLADVRIPTRRFCSAGLPERGPRRAIFARWGGGTAVVRASRPAHPFFLPPVPYSFFHAAIRPASLPRNEYVTPPRQNPDVHTIAHPGPLTRQRSPQSDLRSDLAQAPSSWFWKVAGIEVTRLMCARLITILLSEVDILLTSRCYEDNARSLDSSVRPIPLCPLRSFRSMCFC